MGVDKTGDSPFIPNYALINYLPTSDEALPVRGALVPEINWLVSPVTKD